MLQLGSSTELADHLQFMGKRGDIGYVVGRMRTKGTLDEQEIDMNCGIERTARNITVGST